MNSEAIFGAVRSVTKKWTKQRKSEERHASARLNRQMVMIRRRPITIRDVAWNVIPKAYEKASSGGRFSAGARQVMYAARPKIQEITGRQLDDHYFTQTLLPDYMEEHPETRKWKIVFDARGHFVEPHTEKSVGLGTLEVENYLSDARGHTADNKIDLKMPDASSFPTCGPKNRYSAILFIEKEGFMPLFEEVKLAERYDIAIMSTKGLSVTASRLLVDHLCSAHGIPLLVLHDFDKAGFSIVGTLKRSTRRYRFRNRIKVIDLGLRLADVEENSLGAEGAYNRSDPSQNLQLNGATQKEIQFLRTQRVELNEFTSENLVEWIESKLKKHRISKVVPHDDCLDVAFRRVVEAEYLRDHVKDISEQARKYTDAVTVPDDLREAVRKRLEEDPALSWDTVVVEIAEEQEGEE